MLCNWGENGIGHRKMKELIDKGDHLSLFVYRLIEEEREEKELAVFDVFAC